MKKLFFTLVLLFSVSMAYSQWTYERVDNGFDEPYRIAYTKVNNDCILKLENVNGEVAFYIQGGYFCDEEPLVEMSFLVGSEYHKFYANGTKGDDSKVVFIMDDITGSNILADFKNCSILKIRITDDICDDEIFNFNMTNSTSAYKYILNQ
jgi:hypothetical protein